MGRKRALAICLLPTFLLPLVIFIDHVLHIGLKLMKDVSRIHRMVVNEHHFLCIFSIPRTLHLLLKLGRDSDGKVARQDTDFARAIGLARIA